LSGEIQLSRLAACHRGECALFLGCAHRPFFNCASQ